MIKIRFNTLLCFLIFWVALSQEYSFAQSSISIRSSNDTIEIGDPVDIDITIRLPKSTKVYSLDFSDWKSLVNRYFEKDSLTYERYADIEIIDGGRWKFAESEWSVRIDELALKALEKEGVLTNKVTISFFNVGNYRVTPPKLQIENDDSSIVYGESPEIVVTMPKSAMGQDTLGLNPIKEIFTEKADITDFLSYIYIFIGLILLAGLGYYFYKKKNRTPVMTSDPSPPIIPSHIKALSALKVLDDEKLWQNGQIKEYQSRLTDIIRTYLSDRYSINALEMTTDEIVLDLKKEALPISMEQKLRNVLQIADLVKFAKAMPADDIHGTFMQYAVEFVEHTKDANETAINL